MFNRYRQDLQNGCVALVLGAFVWLLAVMLGAGAIAPVFGMVVGVVGLVILEVARRREQDTFVAVDDRIEVNVKPKYLLRLYKGHSSIQADKLAEPYIGKWIRVSGRVYDITDSLGGCRVSFHQRWLDGPGIDLSLTMVFGPEWRDRLSIMKRGTRIKVRGKIKEVNRAWINLTECELV